MPNQTHFKSWTTSKRRGSPIRHHESGQHLPLVWSGRAVFLLEPVQRADGGQNVVGLGLFAACDLRVQGLGDRRRATVLRRDRRFAACHERRRGVQRFIADVITRIEQGPVGIGVAGVTGAVYAGGV
jgi:hypothetical protein